MENQYQLIVIGTGPGGYVAAIKAAQLGKKVAVIEARDVGGTCLNRGCIPTKAFAHAAGVFREMKTCAALGIHAEGVTYDITAMHTRKNEVVKALGTGIISLLKANKIDLIRGAAVICAAGQVRVGEILYTADKILIATGSKPSRPPIPGLDLPNVVTSDELLTCDTMIYQQLVIIGGGVIGVEFATIYHALGCEVTIIEAMERILPTMDKEIAQNLSMILKKRGVKIFTGARVEKIEKNGANEGLFCHFAAKGEAQTAATDGVLISIGRQANTKGLTNGIDLALERGQIPVDPSFETCVRGIFAVGDVVKGTAQLAHMASAQGINAVCAMFGAPVPMDLAQVPSCIYTDPEIASVGMTADQAKAAGIPIQTGKFIMSANGKSIIEMAPRGFIKLVFHAESRIILGAQMMCCRATDMIGEFVTAIVNQLTFEQLSGVIRPHPTFNEGIMEAIEDVDGCAIHAAPRKKT